MNNLIKSILTTLLLAIGASHSFAEKNQKITFYHYDLLGSPVATTDEYGAVTWREEYSPWGEKLLKEDDAHDNVRGYTGHVNDKETGLTYMQARYYDPQIGRFMGVDPVGFQEKNPISFNRYNYANNNPYKFTDPNGETPLGDEEEELDRLDQEKEEAHAAIEAFMTDKEVGREFLKDTFFGWLAGGMSKLAKGKASPIKTEKNQNIGLDKALELRDLKLKEISKLSKTQQSKITTVVGAHDPATGNVAVGVKVSGKCNSGKCAEDIAFEALGKPKTIEFTPVVRPRNNKIIPRCERCTSNYGEE